MALAMVGISIPNFVVGPLLVLVFRCHCIGCLPARWGRILSWNIILPVLTLSAIYMAYIASSHALECSESCVQITFAPPAQRACANRIMVVRHALQAD